MALKKTIMVVEDNEDTRELLRLHLERKGYKILEADNGAQAVERAARERLDLIIMDLSMPVMDGIEAAGRIREMKHLKETPIIIISAHGNLAIKLFESDNVASAGPILYLPKPFEWPNFDQLLADILPTA